MIRLALTGSIGMGKSATAQMFAARGVAVYDADAAVHAVYGRGGEAVAPLKRAFPGVVARDGSIDRGALRQLVVQGGTAMTTLESIVHPIVSSRQRDFIRKASEAGADIVVLDIPLLFETGGDKRADAIAVVSAPASIQRQRVLARGQMTEAEFEAILARQTPDSVKRRRADFVINTGLGFAYARAQVDAVLAALRTGDQLHRGTDGTCARLSSTQKPQASIQGPTE
ncbi:MAG: dephospho-CoA kinase [Alphaproteobacteria bacterium]|nr:dephospho-CoA kinase [Alphaproteobacteria bacterium]